MDQIMLLENFPGSNAFSTRWYVVNHNSIALSLQASNATKRLAILEPRNLSFNVSQLNKICQ